MQKPQTAPKASARPQITVVCPLKDRPEHFRRFLISLDLLQWKQPVLFLDGSRTPACELVWQDLAAHTRAQHQVFVRSNPDTGWPQFLTKVLIGLRSVETEFVHLTCDDDLPNENVLNIGCSLLRDNSSLSLVSGHVIDFDVRGDKTHAYRDVYGDVVLEPRHMACSGRYVHAAHVDDDSAVARLERQGQVWPYEGIWRTQNLIEAFELAFRAGVTSYRSLLPILRTVCLLRGATHLMAGVITLRQDNTRESDGAEMLSAYPTRLDYFLDDLTAQERRDVTEEIVAFAGSGQTKCDISIAASTWQYHYLLEECKMLRSSPPDERTKKHVNTMMRLASAASSFTSRLVRRAQRRVAASRNAEAGIAKQSSSVIEPSSWYPGETEHLIAAVSSVQSFGNLASARRLFESLVEPEASPIGHQQPEAFQ